LARADGGLMKFNRQRLIFGLYVLVLITITQLVAGYFEVPSWPAFVAWILFFIEEMNIRKTPYILVGAVSGIGLLLLAPLFIGLLTPLIGAQWSTLLYVLLAVYAIVAFGEMVPYILNNYAFLYLTIGVVAIQAPNPNPILWALIASVGGGLLIAGTMLVGKIMGVSVPQKTAD
jgi:hypothetical protein